MLVFKSFSQCELPGTCKVSSPTLARFRNMSGLASGKLFFESRRRAMMSPALSVSLQNHLTHLTKIFLANSSKSVVCYFLVCHNSHGEDDVLSLVMLNQYFSMLDVTSNRFAIWYLSASSSSSKSFWGHFISPTMLMVSSCGSL